MDYTHLPRTIKEPYWSNEKKDQVICQFHYESGPMVIAAVSDAEKGNPDWKEIMETFALEEIDKNTEKIIDEHKRKSDVTKEENKDKKEKQSSDVLFNSKLEAFEIDIIKNSKNRKLKSRIRKAKNLTEVIAFSSALISKEIDNE
jgi:hypothetical protein|tara:strand:+ start:1328 stop:1762 length:435 start_codon:yes stop_codon:yes gene_type:complete